MDNQKSFERVILGLAIALLAFHGVALSFFLYWKYWWFDIFLHFLGGVFVGFLALYLYYYSRYSSPQHFSKKTVFFLALSFTALIGIFWEFFEFASDSFAIALGKREALQQGFRDTLADLFFDLTGALFATCIYIFLWRKK